MNLRPRQIVDELDKHIIGQSEAKVAVAIAMRNRWRRMQVPKPMGDEITPKNILMIGPTGVGKTEIARRLASLAQAPFIKIEATKFTEVGYVGRDVDTIVRDLVEVSVRQVRQQALQAVVSKAAEVAEERLLDLLLPQPEGVATTAAATRERLRQKLRDGELDDRSVEVEASATPLQMEMFSPPGLEDMAGQLQGLLKNAMGSMRKSQKMKVSEARKVLAQEAASQLVNEDDVKRDAIRLAEQSGIVFLDEIDKIASRSDLQGSVDVSRQGVQRDLLPLVEGTTVATKYGPVNTDHILFIASGAFHLSKPSDLIPELQGRFPVRVELKPLTVADFEQILTKTDACLVAQYQALLSTEGVTLSFSADGVRQLAELAYGVNERTMNIGARRLYAMMEKLLAQISFSAGEAGGASAVHIDAAYVEERLADLAVNEDLARYVL